MGCGVTGGGGGGSVMLSKVAHSCLTSGKLNLQRIKGIQTKDIYIGEQG